MKIVTDDEIQASVDFVCEMTAEQTRDFALQLSKEQPFLHIYLAAICQRGDFRTEEDSEIFATLYGIVWHALRTAAGGPWAVVQSKQIDKVENRLVALYEKSDELPQEELNQMSRSWMGSSEQGPLHEFLLKAITDSSSPFCGTEEGQGMIITYVKVLLECLENAKPLKKSRRASPVGKTGRPGKLIAFEPGGRACKK